MTFLRFFTFLPHAELATIEALVKAAPDKREAQTRLAREMTRLIHGEAELHRATSATQALFGTSIRELDERTLLDVLRGAPSTSKPRGTLPVALVDLLAETALCGSKGAARKDIAQGGINLNNERVTDVAALVRSSDLIAGSYVVLRKGKRNYHLVRFE